MHERNTSAIWFQDISQGLKNARNAGDVAGVTMAAMRALGFCFYSYGLRLPIPVSQPQVHILENYPKGWMSHYRDRGYLDVDPTVLQGAVSGNLMIWGNELFRSSPALWDDAQAVGLKVGVAQSAWGSDGSFGLLSFSREGERISETEVEKLRFSVLWLTHAVHAAMSQHLKPQLVPESRAVLTRREREILRWTAEGKTSAEIGAILGVADRTINFHIHNIMGKLNSSNKIQAAVKAVTLGLVQVL